MRFDSRRPRATESKIRPQVRLRKASNIIEAARTAVGNRGTNPVSRKVFTIGIPRIREIRASTTKIIPKKRNGRTSLNNNNAVPKTRQPSLKVLSLLCEPGSRVMYNVGSSANAIFSSSACVDVRFYISKHAPDYVTLA